VIHGTEGGNSRRQNITGFLSERLRVPNKAIWETYLSMGNERKAVAKELEEFGFTDPVINFNDKDHYCEHLKAQMKRVDEGGPDYSLFQNKVLAFLTMITERCSLEENSGSIRDTHENDAWKLYRDIASEPSRLKRSFRNAIATHLMLETAGLKSGFVVDLEKDKASSVYNWVAIGSLVKGVHYEMDRKELVRLDSDAWYELRARKQDNLFRPRNPLEVKHTDLDVSIVFRLEMIKRNARQDNAARFFALSHYLMAQDEDARGEREAADALYMLALQIDPSDPFEILERMG